MPRKYIISNITDFVFFFLKKTIDIIVVKINIALCLFVYKILIDRIEELKNLIILELVIKNTLLIISIIS